MIWGVPKSPLSMPKAVFPTSMAVQKFPTARGSLVRELLNQSHDLQVYDSSVPYEPEVRKRECRKVCANFAFGTLDATDVCAPPQCLPGRRASRDLLPPPHAGRLARNIGYDSGKGLYLKNNAEFSELEPELRRLKAFRPFLGA